MDFQKCPGTFFAECVYLTFSFSCQVIKPTSSEFLFCVVFPDNSAHQYPSSSHYTRNWDKVAKDVDKMEKDEKKEGDAAVNDLFQKIYADGSDEVKKAMNKSFVS